MRTKIIWYDADGHRLSRTAVSAELNVLWFGEGFPDEFRFSGVVQSGSPAFPNQLVTMALTTTAPHPAVVSANCSTPALPVFPMVDPGALTIGPMG